jgi:hypothetical protein
MNKNRAANRYQMMGAWIGALLVGSLFLVVSCLQPLDGVPGYKLITKEDFSIIFAFAFSFIVGAVLGGGLGGLLGSKIGSKVVKQNKYTAVDSSQQLSSDLSFKAPVLEQSALYSPGDVKREFGDLYTEAVFQRAEEYMSKGKPLDNIEIARYAVDRAAEVLMAKYNLDRSEMVKLIEQYFGEQ